MYNAKSNLKGFSPSAGGRDFVHSVIHFTAERCGEKCEVCACRAPAGRSEATFSSETRNNSSKTR